MVWKLLNPNALMVNDRKVLMPLFGILEKKTISRIYGPVTEVSSRNGSNDQKSTPNFQIADSLPNMVPSPPLREDAHLINFEIVDSSHLLSFIEK